MVPEGLLSFYALSTPAQQTLSTAIYCALEVGRLQLALKLHSEQVFGGVPWPNGHCWMKALELVSESAVGIGGQLKGLLEEFQDGYMLDLCCSESDLASFASHLFTIAFSQQAESRAAAEILSHQYSAHHSSSRKHSNPVPSTAEDLLVKAVGRVESQPMIDPKFIDSPELADIRFRLGDKIVYGHRIVLVNASERFREMLRGSGGLVPIEDVSYEVFRVSEGCVCMCD